MNNLIKNSFFLLLTALLFYACDGRENIDYGVEQEKGTLQMKLQVKVTVDKNSPAAKSSISTDNFIVKVYKSSTDEMAKDVNGKDINYKYNEIPDVITLNTGSYYLTASSHEPKNAAWEVPYYQGQQNFTIEKSKLTTVADVVCTLQNVKVTVAYSEKILNELLPDFIVTVDNALENGFLIFGKEETRAGYFLSNSTLKVTLKGTRRDGEAVSHTETITGINPGEERKITLDVILTGTVTSSLKINLNVVLVDHEIKVPTDEGSIIDPDPNPNPDPEPEIKGLTVVGRDFDINGPFPAYPVGEKRTVIVDIDAEHGIKELWVDIDSPFLTEEELTGVGLAKKFNLADASMYEGFGPDGLGLIQEPVANVKKMTFDITLFTSLIGAPGTHNFILTIIDNNNQTLNKTLTLITQ